MCHCHYVYGTTWGLQRLPFHPLKTGVTFDTRVKICRIISDPLLLLTPDLSRLFPYKRVGS